MRIGRRTLFFLGTAGLCLALIPATPSEFRWVNLSMAALALFWAVLLAIEDVVGQRQGRPEGGSGVRRASGRRTR